MRKREKLKVTPIQTAESKILGESIIRHLWRWAEHLRIPIRVTKVYFSEVSGSKAYGKYIQLEFVVNSFGTDKYYAWAAKARNGFSVNEMENAARLGKDAMKATILRRMKEGAKMN